MTVREHSSTDGSVRWYMDEADECCYIETAPLFSHAALGLYLEAAAVCGYAPLDDDECEPELTAEGWTRIYLSLVAGIPMQASPVCEESFVPRQVGRATRRIPHMTAIAAGLTGAGFVLANTLSMLTDVTTIGGLAG